MTAALVAAEKQHAELGASVAARWMACPGSINLSRGLPEPPGTAYALEGTRAHTLAELSLRKDVEPSFFVGMEMDGGVVDEDMAAHVSVFTTHCSSLGGFLQVERKFNLAALNPPGPMFGTADAVVYRRDEVNRLHVIDLKYGQGVVVEVKGNKQLRYYALGALLSLDHDEYPVDEVVITIVQPRVSHPDGMVRSETVTTAELLDFAGELMAAARATTQPDAALVPGSHCRFCPASGICPAQRERVQQSAEMDFSVVPVEAPRAPETLTKEELTTLMPLFPMIEDWMGAVRAHVQSMLERGEEVPGWKLVQKRAVRKWTDEGDVRAALLASGWKTEDIDTEPELRSPAQIEKLLGKKRFAEKLGDSHVVKVSSGVTLAAAHDNRPAVVLTRGEEFAVLPRGD